MSKVLTVRQLGEIAFVNKGWHLSDEEKEFLQELERLEDNCCISVELETLTEQGFHQEMKKAMVAFRLGTR
ncbi:MAG: hypothetical protein QMC93_03280 [Patescibacteria group bacterium]|nr:hypothetical protein [Patescibacteria group bacterium]